MTRLNARVICSGNVSGDVLFTDKPLLIYTGIDTVTGKIVERGHPLSGTSVSGRVLVFPEAKGSTVGSWTLLQLKKNGVAPLAIVNQLCEPIVATGVIMARIPCVDKVDINLLRDCKRVTIAGGEINIDDNQK
jgi:predicted aconitase with swiveling domain